MGDGLSVTLPGAQGRTTSRLGIGMATLMREPSRRARARVLDAAYAHGFRHFDVAPLYGLGTAERELGAFVRRHPDVTVATKFGQTPSGAFRMAARVQAPVRAVIRRSQVLRRMTRLAARQSAVAVTAPTLVALRDSLGRSIELLGVDRIDVLLLHDVEWSEGWAEIWEQVQSGAVFDFADAVGLAGSHDRLETYPRGVRESSPVCQTAVDARTLAADGSAGFAIFYGALSGHLASWTEVLRVERERRTRLERLLDTSLRSDSEVAALLLSRILERHPRSISLVGTTDPRHAGELWAGVARCMPAIAANRGDIERALGPLSGA